MRSSSLSIIVIHHHPHYYYSILFIIIIIIYQSSSLFIIHHHHNNLSITIVIHYSSSSPPSSVQSSPRSYDEYIHRVLSLLEPFSWLHVVLLRIQCCSGCYGHGGCPASRNFRTNQKGRLDDKRWGGCGSPVIISSVSFVYQDRIGQRMLIAETLRFHICGFNNYG